MRRRSGRGPPLRRGGGGRRPPPGCWRARARRGARAAVAGLLHRSEEVAPPTVITGSGSGASSLRGFTRALMQSQRQNTARWGGAVDPVAAAEDIAHTNLGDIGQSITAPQMLPARSPDLRNPDDPPAVRTSLTFAAA